MALERGLLELLHIEFSHRVHGQNGVAVVLRASRRTVGQRDMLLSHDILLSQVHESLVLRFLSG